MQSHLTRRVFRAILNNEPLHSQRCRHCLAHTIPSCRPRRPALSYINHGQRRGFLAFNMASPPESEQRSTILPSETGLKAMRDLEYSLADKSRGPSNNVLTKAFKGFFGVRAETPGFITGFQAHLLNVTWEHLKAQQEELEPEDWAAIFSTESLENILFVLSEAACLPESRGSILNLAHSAFMELCADHGFGPDEVSRHALVAYVSLLSLNGNPEKAQEVVEKFWDKLRKAKPSPWLVVMKGFALQDNRKEMKLTAGRLQRDGRAFDPDSHEEITKFFIDQGLLNAVQIIYECPISNGQEPTFAAKEAVIKHALCKSRTRTAWAKPIYKSIAQRPIAETMDIALLWEAAQRKSALKISETAKDWIAKDPAAQASLTISCVNDLIRFAIAWDNPQLAAEFAGLAPQWRLQPDLQTKLLQLETCWLADDLNGVLGLLQDLPDLSSIALENLPLMNKLVTMLCWSDQEDILFNQISGLLEPLLENNVRLEGKTIAALTRLLLYRHDWEAVSELLRPRLGSYESDEATIIRNVLTDYILDGTQGTDDAWAAYSLLRLAFPETGAPMRTDIMDAFFQRDRSDLACLVFGHMRQSEDPKRRPKSFAYARCFQGIARTGDAKNLELVHNMLKLDTEVDLNTQVRNGLMLAYSSCEMAEKSMELFREILLSDEGPTHRTIAIFFKACESHHNGVQEALKMMKKAKDLEIGIDRRIYTTYIVALATHCEFELATEALGNMHAETGYTPSRKS